MISYKHQARIEQAVRALHALGEYPSGNRMGRKAIMQELNIQVKKNRWR